MCLRALADLRVDGRTLNHLALFAEPRSDEEVLRENLRVIVRDVTEGAEGDLGHYQYVADEHRLLDVRHLVAGVLHAGHFSEVIHEDLGEGPRASCAHDVGEGGALARVVRGDQLAQVLLGEMDKLFDDGVAWLRHHDELRELDGVGLALPDSVVVLITLDSDDDIDLVLVLVWNPVLHGLSCPDVDVGPHAALLEQDEVAEIVGLHDRIVELGEQVRNDLGEVINNVGVFVCVRDALVAVLGVYRSPFVAEAFGAFGRVLGVVFPALPQLSGPCHVVDALE